MDPDLASVLNTLSALSGVQSTPTPTPTPTAQSTAPATPGISQNTPAPAAPAAPGIARHTPAQTATGTTTTATGIGTGPGIGEKDPRKITTWPPALRYITAKAQQPAFLARLKQLLASQRAHERKWWQGREAVVKRLQEREGRRGEVEGVLYVLLVSSSHGIKEGMKLMSRRAVGAPIIDYKVSFSRP